MFDRGSKIAYRANGSIYQVHATPDMAVILYENGDKVPCYGLQSLPDHNSKLFYLSQTEVEGGDFGIAL